MTNILEGTLSAEGMKFGVVVGRFNEFISSKLLGGTLDCLKRHQGNENDIDVAWVPGAFEIPLMAKKLAKTKKYDAVICLGAVIRGTTPHFDFVSAEVAKGISKVSLDEELIWSHHSQISNQYFQKCTHRTYSYLRRNK